MFSPRIIPVLLSRSGGLVKSVRFKDHRYIGDPINAVHIFNESFADEIVILDIDATNKKSVIDLQLVKGVGEEANMPFSVGGGIDSMKKIEQILKSGAEKVIINTAALINPDFIREASRYFGSSTITVCVDIKKNLFGKYQVYSHTNGKSRPDNYFSYIKRIEDAGAGEIIVQSVDEDGAMEGYDNNLYEELSCEINIPIIALGGAGSISDIKKLWSVSSVNSFGAGSMFVYLDGMKGVLINYPKVDRNEFREKFRK